MAHDQGRTKRTTIFLPESLHKRLKVAAVQDDTTMSDLIRQAVETFLAQRDRQQRPSQRTRPPP